MAKRGQAVPRQPTKRKASPKRNRAPRRVDLKNQSGSLRRELTEARQQLTATREVLEVINASPGTVAPVFEALLQKAMHLCEAAFGFLATYDGERFKFAAQHGVPTALANYFESGLDQARPGDAHWRLLAGEDLIHNLDQMDEDAYRAGNPLRRTVVDLGGARSALVVALRKDGILRGAITVYRKEVRPFSATQIALLQHFASQAVIAIENARLFNEVRARTEDLHELLQQQTATADVLKVISRSAFDLEFVLATLVASAARLCEAERGLIFLRQGNHFRMAANYGFSPELEAFARANPFPIDSASTTIRAAMSGSAVQAVDVLADATQGWLAREYQRLGGHRTNLGVPLRRDGETIGVFTLTRQVVRPFTEKQIELVSTFADQAVIAIENVRLFDEVQARTNDLSESLQQQTATADVLKVISRSAFDLHAVFETLVESSVRLCGADRAFIFRFDGELLRMAAAFNCSPEFTGWVEQHPIQPGRHSGAARAALERRTIHIPDVWSDPDYAYGARDVEAIRTVLGVPILKSGDLLGVIMIFHLEVRPFTDKQIALVETFADQAAIAIENVRLFDEVQARTEDLREFLQQQTATADVLKVISRSTFDLETVLRTLVELAARLCEADKATITRQREGAFYRAESFGFSREFMDHVRDILVTPDRGSATGRALLEGVAVHIPDVEADPDYHFDEAQRLGGYRTLLGIPMLREGMPIGVLTLTRSESRPFTEKQIELVTTFADQAAIAIENVRLFDEVQERTKELSKSLDDLRAAQDRLIQTEKLASLGQLTAGIAHEIKNPLNFVNNFSALSVELVDELDDVLKPAPLDPKTREETDELTEMLKGNLEKVVQHGKRADFIVKNMLLHSREGSSERRLVNLNRLVEESLNLAYHGARAENQDFKISLEQSFDPTVGKVDLFPQEITRVVINLISNGFYAATKRKAELKLNGYEPVLAAATRNLGDSVEIRIRDNGGGIPPEVKEKIFNPFFTTKPPGQGTGLGLSLSYDIVVKQHAGSIEVDTQPGEFTEIKVILPRTAGTSKAGPNK